MADDKPSLMNIGDLAEPVTALVNRVSDAIGGLALPWQIVRTAKAEAEAEKIRALAGIEVSEIQKRGLARLINEAGRQQENIEGVTAKSLFDVSEDARPDDIETDWLVNFFDKCKNVSDEEMQSLWAKLLAGEANLPGTFSKRTVEFVNTLSKQDARDFTTLCGYCCEVGDEDVQPFIYDYHDDLYKGGGVNFDFLSHLESIGLIIFGGGQFYSIDIPPQNVILKYFDEEVMLTNEVNLTHFEVGVVLLTKMGLELRPISGATKVEGFLDFIAERYLREGIATQCPLPSPKTPAE